MDSTPSNTLPENAPPAGGRKLLIAVAGGAGLATLLGLGLFLIISSQAGRVVHAESNLAQSAPTTWTAAQPESPRRQVIETPARDSMMVSSDQATGLDETISGETAMTPDDPADPLLSPDRRAAHRQQELSAPPTDRDVVAELTMRNLRAEAERAAERGEPIRRERPAEAAPSRNEALPRPAAQARPVPQDQVNDEPEPILEIPSMQRVSQVQPQPEQASEATQPAQAEATPPTDLRVRVQFGVFSEDSAAMGLRDDLQLATEIEIRVVESPRGFVVITDWIATRDAAEALLADVANLGYDGFIRSN